MLKFKVTKDQFAGLSESIKALYTTNDDGNHYLQVEGAVAKERVDEFRNNNIELKRKLDVFSEVDMDAYNGFKSLGIETGDIAGLIDTQAQIRDKKLFDNKDIEGLVSAQVKDRIGLMTTEHTAELSKVTAALGKSDARLEDVLISNDLQTAASSVGVLSTAMNDVLLRGRQVFKLQDGVSTPHDSNGGVIYGSDGVKALTTKEWVTGLKQSAPHLFSQPAGGGIKPGAPGFSGDTSKMSSIQKISAGLSEQ